MSKRIPTYVHATDSLSEEGILSRLRPQPEIELVVEGEFERARVAIVVADSASDATVAALRGIKRQGCPNVVVVIGDPDDASLLALVEAGVCGVLRRSEATATALVRLVEAASHGDGSLPPDLLGRLIEQVGRM